MDKSKNLFQTPLFQETPTHLGRDDLVRLSYRRAQAIGQLYAFTPHDILQTTKKYWDLHTDPLVVSDGAVATLLTIHYNLCCGTLAKFASGHQDVADILRQLLAFDISGQYCLTELGHGLNAIDLETTATLQEDGGFILNTPVASAAKFMPPTSPSGFPCIAVVFARLIVGSEYLGIKPFIVSLHDGFTMAPGIISTALTPRGGADYIEHCLTSFSNVRLPRSALLGSLRKELDPRKAFFSNIDRVIVGSLTMAAFSIPHMKIATCIAARYSKRRKVTDAHTRLARPILSFPTQQIPVLTTIAQAMVLQSCLQACIKIFTNQETSSHLRHCIAAIAKAVMVPQCQAAILSLSERCGAQGVFAANRLVAMHGFMRGAGIAEGDILVVSIRFATEILLGRIDLPPPVDAQSLVARHEAHMIQTLRGMLSSMESHRSERFERLILPRCQPLLEAIGHRIAYDAARKDRLDEDIINLYLANCFKSDPGWYTEHGGIPLAEQRSLEAESVVRLFPRLDELLGLLDVDVYATAPMVSDEKWAQYVEQLTTYRGSASLADNHRIAHL